MNTKLKQFLKDNDIKSSTFATLVKKHPKYFNRIVNGYNPGPVLAREIVKEAKKIDPLTNLAESDFRPELWD